MPLPSVSFRRRLIGHFALAAALAISCTPTPRGAEETHLARAQDRATQGATLFEAECASCHGQRGQGLANGPAILGPGALPEFPAEATSSGNPQLANPGQVRTQRLTQVPGAPSRAPFRSAADVQQYISTRMPFPPRRSGSLKAEEYWAITTFMLLAHGVELPADGLTRQNAASIPLERQPATP